VSHWTDGLESDADDSLVRPFTITRGRTASRQGDLELITVVMATGRDEDETSRRPGLEPEHRKILEQCSEPVVVAEIAAHLDLPVSVTKILIGDLIESSMVTTRAPLQSAGGPTLDLDLLRAVREGLERL
jgi:hypothetical protein